MLYRFEDVTKSYGPKAVLRGVSWQHNPGERVGLIGKNGAGKTTLVRLIQNREETDAGRVLRVSNLTMASVDQMVPGDLTETLEDFVGGAFADLHRIEMEMRRLEHGLADGSSDAASIGDRYEKLQHRFENEGGYAMHAEIERCLDGFGFGRPDFARMLSELSGGQKNRAMLGRAILSEPDLLLLDEPTNHLDYAGMEFLEEYLHDSRRACLVVSHDRRFLNKVATKIVELEFGRLTEYPGNYEAYQQIKAERLLSAAHAFEKQRDYIEKTEEFIRRNIAGQKTKQARGRRTHLAKVQRLENPTEESTRVAFDFQTARKGGRSFLRADNLDAGYTPGEPVVGGVSFELLRGERMAILGENGSGKSTLLKTLAGRLTPLAGSFATGHEVSAGYYDQELRDLPAANRVVDAIWDLHRSETELEVRSYLAMFDFREEDVFAPIAGLSGGEKGRLSLAIVMKQNHNLLLLDEPTNHLDVHAREALEGALGDFAGSIVFVSHDRAFVDRLATHVLDLDRGFAVRYEGTYSSTLEARRERRRLPAPSRLAAIPVSAVKSATPESRRVLAGPKVSRSDADREGKRREQKIARLEKRIAGLEADVEQRETRLFEEGDRLDLLTSTRLWREKEDARRKLEELVEEWSELASVEAS